MEAFAQFASDLDATTQKLLARGARLTELLKQSQYAPLSVAEQVLSIYAGTRGYMDGIAVKEVNAFESGLIDHARSAHADLLDEIDKTGLLSEESEKQMVELLESYTKTFAA